MGQSAGKAIYLSSTARRDKRRQARSSIAPPVKIAMQGKSPSLPINAPHRLQARARKGRGLFLFLGYCIFSARSTRSNLLINPLHCLFNCSLPKSEFSPILSRWSEPKGAPREARLRDKAKGRGENSYMAMHLTQVAQFVVVGLWENIRARC